MMTGTDPVPIGGSQDPVTSNGRPITIFTSYMLLALSLTILILRAIYVKSKNQSLRTSETRTNLPLYGAITFFLLALISLAATWFYMFAFFAHSYRSWSNSHGRPAELQLGSWLHDTKLFKEAWGTAVETPQRNWWTRQIFLFAAGWSVFLGQEGYRRNIPYIWAFMLLGQIVAISFAMNLSFLSATLSPLEIRHSSWTPPTWLIFPPLILTFLIVEQIHPLTNPRYLLTLLLLPHVLVFIPALASQLIPARCGSFHPGLKGGKRWYTRVHVLVALISLVLVFRETCFLYERGERLSDIVATLWEHPAVSSVGCDVLMCWLSAGTWLALQLTGSESTIETKKA